MTGEYLYDPWKYPIIKFSDRSVEIEHQHGSAVVSYVRHSKLFQIQTIDVDEGYRRQGIAKDLLRYTKHLAENLGATMIMAAIISRESHDAFSSVFGEGLLRSGLWGLMKNPMPEWPTRPETKHRHF